MCNWVLAWLPCVPLCSLLLSLYCFTWLDILFPGIPSIVAPLLPALPSFILDPFIFHSRVAVVSQGSSTTSTSTSTLWIFPPISRRTHVLQCDMCFLCCIFVPQQPLYFSTVIFHMWNWTLHLAARCELRVGTRRNFTDTKCNEIFICQPRRCTWLVALHPLASLPCLLSHQSPNTSSISLNHSTWRGTIHSCTAYDAVLTLRTRACL